MQTYVIVDAADDFGVQACTYVMPFRGDMSLMRPGQYLDFQ